METLNCQGLACPQPVVEVRNFLAAHPQTAGINGHCGQPGRCSECDPVSGDPRV